MVNEWKPKPFDLGLSTALAILLPVVANWLFLTTGALIPMIIYYGLAWGVVMWRRGTTGYRNKFNPKNIPAFFINVGVIVVSLIFAYFARIVVDNPQQSGVILTALIWAPVNAASEQLLWIYIFESWDLYLPRTAENKRKNNSYRIIGLLLFSTFVGTIHTMYWANFLHTVSATSLIGVFFILATTVSGYMHLVVWRKSNQMVLTFIPHFILNLVPLFWTGYSIIPYLWK